jgi:hypothetical protein
MPRPCRRQRRTSRPAKSGRPLNPPVGIRKPTKHRPKRCLGSSRPGTPSKMPGIWPSPYKFTRHWSRKMPRHLCGPRKSNKRPRPYVMRSRPSHRLSSASYCLFDLVDLVRFPIAWFAPRYFSSQPARCRREAGFRLASKEGRSLGHGYGDADVRAIRPGHLQAEIEPQSVPPCSHTARPSARPHA